MITLAAKAQDLISGWLTVAGSGTFTEGQCVLSFEEEVAKWANAQGAAALNSAGSGLFALMACLPQGTAIVPNNTFFATGAMPVEAGWKIVLADCSPDDFCLTPESILHAESRSQTRITAVVLTHVGGLATRYEEIAALCAQKGWALIEDAAHVLGAERPSGLKAGQLGLAAVFSLYPTKAVPVGEGGVVVSRDSNLLRAVKEFRNYGKSNQDGVIRYSRGFNLRMDEWTSVVGCAQMKALPGILERRREAAEKLSRVVKPLTDWGQATNWYKYPVTSRFASKRQTGKIYQVTDQLASALQMGGHFPHSRDLAERHICLPLGEHLYDGLGPIAIEDYLMERV